MRLFTPALLLASPLLAEAACRFEFWQYDNFSYKNGEWHAYMVRADVYGDNMNFPKMIDDFCSIFNTIGNTGGGSLPRECIRDSNTSGHARTDYSEGWEGVQKHHERYLRIIDELKFAGYGVCDFVNHASF